MIASKLLTAFATKEDQEAFTTCEFTQNARKAMQERGVPEPRSALFTVHEFPKDKAPRPFVRFSRITVSDEGKMEEVKTVYQELMAAIGQDTFGGRSVDGEQIVGLGITGFDNLDDALQAFEKPEAKAVLEKYRKLGECKDVIVKLAVM